MASIEKRGDSFRISVSLWYVEQQSQIRKTTTYKQPAGTSPQRARKLADEQAVLFEQKVKGLTAFMLRCSR